jgi:hypothetical protein
MSPLRRPTRATALLRALLTLLLIAVATARPAAAQGGTVEGTALRVEDGTPIPFALVRLLRAESRAGSPGASVPVVQQAATNANGRFRIAEVPAGEYRLQLARIGYEPVLSPVLHVGAGHTLRQDLRGASRALQLAAVTVRPEAGCLTLARLDDDARLASVWQEARKGIETRLAFERQYRYTRIAKQDGVARFRLFRRGIHTVDTTRSEPDSVEVRRQRRVAELRTRGHKGADGRFTIPNEKDLLDEAYMREQCLELVAGDSAAGPRVGAVGLRFHPVRPRKDVIDVGGTLWLDAGTFLARRLEVRWMRGGDTVARGSVRYDDVAVGGSPLRFPVGAEASLTPSALVAKAIIAGASSTIVMRYLDFEQVAAR